MFWKRPSSTQEVALRIETARRMLIEQSCLAEYHTAMAEMLRARIDRMLADSHLSKTPVSELHDPAQKD